MRRRGSRSTTDVPMARSRKTSSPSAPISKAVACSSSARVTPPEPQPAAHDGPRRWRHYAFGLDISSDIRVPQLPLARTPTGLPATVTRLAPADVAGWRYPREDILVDRRHADGKLMIGVDQTERGYRVWSPQHGRYIVSADGLEIRAAIGTASAWKWQRLFFAQVLPLTAALRGLEVLHASAV